MRGKHFDSIAETADGRITPADAGKTIGVGVIYSEIWDHPRGCGENCNNYETAQFITGSPPRMRGKREDGILVRVRQRITPADAGKTC